MPIRKKISDFCDEIGEYFLALFHHWRTLVSGASVGLICWLYSVRTATSIPTSYYVSILVGAALISSFLAWRDEYLRRLSQEQRTLLPSSIEVAFEGLRAEHNDLLAQLGATTARSLTEAQHTKIAETIKKLTGDDGQKYPARRIAVFSVPGVHDSEAYAAQLRSALREGGIASEAATVNDDEARDYRSGIVIKGWDGEEPMTPDVVKNALGAAGITVRQLQHDQQYPYNFIKLIVGGRDLLAEAREPGEMALHEQERFRARRLTAEQREIISKSLGELVTKEKARDGTAAIHVLAGVGADCGDYARQFEEVFSAAAIRVYKHSPPYDPSDDFYYGLWVRWDRVWRDKYGFPHDGPAFAEALIAAGIKVTIIEREGSFTSLIVGSRKL